MWSWLMYGLRLIHAPIEQYLALSSGPFSSATSGAVPLLIARRMSVGCLPPTLLMVIHGAVFVTPFSTLLNCLSSRPVKKLQTVSVTGLCELFAGGELPPPAPPAVHAARIRLRPATIRVTRRFIPHPQPRRRIRLFSDISNRPKSYACHCGVVNRSGPW